MQAQSLVILNGISGSGKSTALKAFDDLGYFCIDNLPAPLIPGLVHFLLDLPAKWARPQFVPPGNSENASGQKFALLVSCRDEDAFPFIQTGLGKLKERGVDVSLLYFDCQDEVVIRRFSETRRPHPLIGLAGYTSIAEALERERWLLADFRAAASRIIDTTRFSPHDMRRAIESYIGRENRLELTIRSFGFKYGVPNDIDLLLDVRFLPNPHFVPELQPLTGIDERVRKYVFQTGEAENLIEKYFDLLQYLIPRYRQEGKSYLTVGIGCTGGKHRSVAVAEAIAEKLTGVGGAKIGISHRDMTRLG